MKKLWYTAAVALIMGVNIQAHAQVTNGLQAYYPFGGNAQDQRAMGITVNLQEM